MANMFNSSSVFGKDVVDDIAILCVHYTGAGPRRLAAG